MSALKSTFSLCVAVILITSTAHAQLFTSDVYIQGSLCVGLDCVNGEGFGFYTIRLKENNTQIRFEDTSTGTFPQTDWTIGANETNNGGKNLFFIDDDAHRIVTIEGGAPTNSLYVHPSGRIGIRTDNPAMNLQMASGDTPAMRLEQNNSAGYTAQSWDVAGNETNFFVRNVNTNQLPFKIIPGAPNNSLFIQASGNTSLGSGTENGRLYVNGNLTVNGDVTVLSDKRMKTNVQPLNYGLAAILKLQPRSYTYLQDGTYDLTLPEGTQLGLIAQETDGIIPEIVRDNFQVTDNNGRKTSLKSIDYIELVPVLIKAIQEQQELIAAKDAELAEIKSQLAALSQKVDTLVAKAR